MLVCRGAQLLVPAGELEFLTSSERKGAREMDGIVGTQGMSACARGRLSEKHIVNGVDIDPPPEVLQVIEPSAKLGGSQSSSLAHPGKGCGCLDAVTGTVTVARQETSAGSQRRAL